MDEETKQELLDIENALSRLDQAERDLHREMRKPAEQMGVIQAKALLEIAAAKDETGRKPLYPNEKVRQAALTVRLHEDSEYQALKEQYASLDGETEKIRVERARLQKRREILWLSLGPYSGQP
jgi:hypothetical protein